MTNAVNLASAAGTGFSFRNYIINGNFDFWQRGTATPSWSSPVTNYYLADRWLGNSSGTGGNGSMSRQAFTVGQTEVPGEPTYFLRWQITSAATGQTAGGSYIEQRVEDVRSLAGKTVTLSFYAKGTGTLPFVYATQTFGSGGSAQVVLTLATNVVLNSTWTKYTYTFSLPSISGKTIGTNSYVGITINVPINATYTLDLAQVQLEEGSVATPFERRPYGLEEMLCQRFFEKGQQPFFYMNVTGVTFGYADVRFSATKRASPTIVMSGFQYYSGGSAASFTPLLNAARVDKFDFMAQSVTNFNGWPGTGTWTASAEL